MPQSLTAIERFKIEGPTVRVDFKLVYQDSATLHPSGHQLFCNHISGRCQNARYYSKRHWQPSKGLKFRHLLKRTSPPSTCIISVVGNSTRHIVSLPLPHNTNEHHGLSCACNQSISESPKLKLEAKQKWQKACFSESLETILNAESPRSFLTAPHQSSKARCRTR